MMKNNNGVVRHIIILNETSNATQMNDTKMYICYNFVVTVCSFGKFVYLFLYYYIDLWVSCHILEVFVQVYKYSV